MAEKIGNNGTIKSIQILRAIAALSVVYVHCTTAGDYKFPSAGSFGVDIFFVISGFIIAYMVSRNTEDFLIKRIIRIWPLYILATIAMAMTVALFPNLIHSTTVSISGFIKSVLFIPGPENRGSPVLGQGWTLNFEMLFYVSMALCVAFIKNKKYIAVICAGALVLFLIMLHLVNIDSYILTVYKNGLMPEFIFGILLYYAYSFYYNRKHGKTGIVKTMVFVTMAVISYLYMGYSEITGFSIMKNRNINWGIPALAIVAAVLFLENDIKENRLVKFFVWMGEASYAMYLFHYHIVTFFSRIVFPKTLGTKDGNIIIGLIKITLGIVFTIILSLIIYEMIDKQIQKHLRRLLKKIKNRS